MTYVTDEFAIMQWFDFSLQEVKSQPQNILLDAIFDDPWTNAYRLELCKI